MCNDVDVTTISIIDLLKSGWLRLIPGDLVWITLMGSGDFSHNGVGCVLPTMNVSHVYYLCCWILFPCFMYVLSVTHVVWLQGFLLGVL